MQNMQTPHKKGLNCNLNQETFLLWADNANHHTTVQAISQTHEDFSILHQVSDMNVTNKNCYLQSCQISGLEIYACTKAMYVTAKLCLGLYLF